MFNKQKAETKEVNAAKRNCRRSVLVASCVVTCPQFSKLGFFFFFFFFFSDRVTGCDRVTSKVVADSQISLSKTELNFNNFFFSFSFSIFNQYLFPRYIQKVTLRSFGATSSSRFSHEQKKSPKKKYVRNLNIKYKYI